MNACPEKLRAQVKVLNDTDQLRDINLLRLCSFFSSSSILHIHLRVDSQAHTIVFVCFSPFLLFSSGTMDVHGITGPHTQFVTYKALKVYIALSYVPFEESKPPDMPTYNKLLVFFP